MKHKLLDTSTAQSPTGLPTQRRLFRVPRGAFSSRLVALYARTGSNLAFTFADPPFTLWSAPVDFVTESDELPFDAVMDEDGNLHVAYTQSGTGALRVIKLAYVNGNWSPQSAVTVYDAATSANTHPSIVLDAYNRLWVAWARDDAGTITLRVKSSVDGGVTWGAGSSDAGTDLSGSVASVHARLVARPTHQHCLYTTPAPVTSKSRRVRSTEPAGSPPDGAGVAPPPTHLHCLYTIGGTQARHRKIDLDAALWDAADILYSGSGLSADITGAVAPDGKLGALFVADSMLFLKEYDGAMWGALQTVSDQLCLSPSLRYVGLTPYALFLRNIGTDQNRLLESHRSGATFTTSAPVLPGQSPFASVFCHDADAPIPFADLTTQAESTSGGDIAHPTSGGLLESISDALYLGADARFSFARFLLSQVGVAGVVTWAYWNGAEWTAFVPASGSYDFTSANKGVRLFTDDNATPADWQKTTVNGANRYWIRILCTTAFTTVPIGSQITSVPEMTHLSMN